MSAFQDDTIAAIATPLGAGGIGIVRVSGPEAGDMLRRVFLPLSPRFAGFRPWTLHRGRVVDGAGEAVDDALAVFMPGPRTFTGEDVAEIHCHGGPAIVRAVLESLMNLGARPAERGEFSRRALLNGRMDLTQAEAVAEMIAAPTRGGLRMGLAKLDGLLGRRVEELRRRLEELRLALCVAVDFPEDEVECLSPEEFLNGVRGVAGAVADLLQSRRRCRCWQEGALVVLGGPVNAGKSSLMNALLGRNRALVTDVPGTTRDFLEEYIDLDGLPVRLTDTAGLRRSADAVEALGVERSRERLRAADVTLLVLDGGKGPRAAQDLEDEAAVLLQKDAPPAVLVWNKADIAPQPCFPPAWVEAAVSCVVVCALDGQGLEDLAQAVRQAVLDQGGGEPRPGDLAPNLRQAAILENALAELHFLGADIENGLPYDVCAVRLDAAAALLGGIVGIDTPAQVLDRVFSTFCIGK